MDCREHEETGLRAARLETTGLDELRVMEVDRPTPLPGEVLIEVHTVGVNQLDLNVIGGTGPGAAARLPRTLGLDPAGIIVEVGEGVPADRIGERVVAKPNISCGDCRYCAEGHEADCVAQTALGAHLDGGAAEFVTLPARNAFAIGDLDWATATAAVHSVPIVLHAIAAAGGVSAGETALVTGAGGTLGQVAIDILLHRGADVVAVSRKPLTERAGVRCLRVEAAEDIPQAVRQLLPAGASFAIDVSGHGPTTAAAVRALAWKGRAVTCAASLDPGIPLDGRDLYLQRKSLVGAASANYAEVAEALELVRGGFVMPAVGERFPLERIVEAYAAFSRADRAGKVVVDVR